MSCESKHFRYPRSQSFGMARCLFIPLQQLPKTLMRPCDYLGRFRQDKTRIPHTDLSHTDYPDGVPQQRPSTQIPASHSSKNASRSLHKPNTQPHRPDLHPTPPSLPSPSFNSTLSAGPPNLKSTPSPPPTHIHQPRAQHQQTHPPSSTNPIPPIVQTFASEPERSCRRYDGES